MDIVGAEPGWDEGDVVGCGEDVAGGAVEGAVDLWQYRHVCIGWRVKINVCGCGVLAVGFFFV